MEVSSLLVFMLYAVPVVWAQAGGATGLASLRLGRSLSVENKESDFLISPKGTFSSGFYQVGTNAYCYSIWFTNSVNKTVVWMANRERPVNGKRSKLTLDRNGNLVLNDADGSIVWSTKTTISEADVEARILETGNLVLINQGGKVIWESFDSPTDTLLPNQLLDRNRILVSRRQRGTYSSGYYVLKFGDNNVLNLIYNGPLVSSVYLPTPVKTAPGFARTTDNSSRVAVLDDLGGFISSDNFLFNASDYGFGPKRRLTLDYDGVLRLYSLDESTGLWEDTLMPWGDNPCKAHGQCGAYAICSYIRLYSCSCPYGFSINDPSDWSKGCSPQFNLSCNPAELDFIMVPYTDYFGYDLFFYSGISLDACRHGCLNDCRCQGFGYSMDGKGFCYQKSTLLNGYHLLYTFRFMHIKVPKEMAIARAGQGLIKPNYLNCSDAKAVLFGAASGEEGTKQHGYMKYLLAFLGSIAAIETILIGLVWWYLFRKHALEEVVNMGYIALAMEFKRFTFAELKRATQNFKQEIGRGGFGTVYRGILDNERVVAVKRLEGIFQGDAEFWAEVSIIGKLNHRNLVKMWGFCCEGEHKLLVYEYMQNGSLDKILFSDLSRTLGLGQRYNIALGTAKGLSYIHEECLEWVLHCDVKPENILLDDQFEPKLTDFGLSKLFKDNLETGFSCVRGTRGYLAPEWMMNLNINAKADVYSYGIVLLELVTGKRASSFQLQAGQGNKHSHLVQWVRQQIQQYRLMEVIDSRPNFHDYNREKLERLVKVALLCAGEDRDARPSMSKVVELLTGDDDESNGDEERLGVLTEVYICIIFPIVFWYLVLSSQ